MRAVVYLVVGLVLGLVVLAALWPVARHRLIYPGGTLSPDRSDPSVHGLPHGEEVWLEADDGVRIHAWWVPAGGAPGAVVYFHGNAETMATRAWIADRLSRMGYHTLLFDYRGYGLSEGRASEEGLARDARTAWRHVVETRDVPPDRVVLMGHSLGSAVAARLALELQDTVGGARIPADGPATTPGSTTAAAGPDRPAAGTGRLPAGLIVGAPFPGMPALFGHHAPWLPDRALRWRTERLAAGSRLDEVRAPVLVVIGSEDDVIPPGMSREIYRDLADASGRAEGPVAPVLVTVPADHATMMGHPDVWAALEEFLERALP